MTRRNPFEHPGGWVEIFCGPMFSGKTDRLLEHATRMHFAKAATLVVSPARDTRQKDGEISSRGGRRLKAISVANSAEFMTRYDQMKRKPVAIYFDEAQFFDEGIVAVIEKLAKEGKLIAIAGLDTDFRGEPFGPMGSLLAIAEKVTKLSAACSVCGAKASRSQRIINGIPAGYGDQQVKIGDKEEYQPRCREHHSVVRHGTGGGK